MALVVEEYQLILEFINSVKPVILKEKKRNWDRYEATRKNKKRNTGSSWLLWARVTSARADHFQIFRLFITIAADDSIVNEWRQQRHPHYYR